MKICNNICIVAGEASGDLQAALLIQCLKIELQKNFSSEIKFWGSGGSELRKIDVEILVNIEDLAVLGILEFIPKYLQISKSYKLLLEEIKIRMPIAVIFVDYPGFNLRLMQDVYNLGIITIYHIPPKVWAHNLQRIQLLKKYANLITGILPFELECFKKADINLKFIGNPLKDHIDKYKLMHVPSKTPGHIKIAILPGSREHEIKKLLELLVHAFLELEKLNNQVFAYIPIANTISKNFIDKILDRIKIKFNLDEAWFKTKFKISYNNSYEILNSCDYAWICSGTATLEAAFFAVPMSTVYKVSWFTFYIAKKYLKIKYISLVNLCVNKEIIPEFIQESASVQNLVNHALYILNNKIPREKMLDELRQIQKLFPKNSVENASREIINCIKKHSKI